jgi:ATP-dependent DNA helicase RecQ
MQDWTMEAMKFLSCVARCKERFGMSHIIDILRGSKNQKVMQNKHHELSTYGIGKDRTVDEWRTLGRSLLHQGLIEQTDDGYSVLKLNALSWEVMRKQRTVSLAIPVKPKVAITPQSTKAAAADMLMYRLRSLRKQLADEQSVPPYVIFADSTLKLMSQVQPQTRDDFGKLSGVGRHKLSQYGDRFLAEIRAYRQEQGLSSSQSQTTSENNYPSSTELITFQLYQQGLSITQIAKQRNLRTTTIVRHLCDLIEKNQSVDINELVPKEKQQKILQVLESLGDISLTPIKEYLGDSYSFDEIRLVRGKWRRKNHKSTI